MIATPASVTDLEAVPESSTLPSSTRFNSSSLPTLTEGANVRLSTGKGPSTDETCNQDRWEAELKGNGADPEVFRGFGEPRYEVMLRLTRAGVERPRWEAAPLTTYLEDPAGFIDPLRSERVHFFIEPVPGAASPRLKFKDITRAEALELAESLKSFPDKERFVATVVESPKLLFHGNVTVYSGDDCAPSPTTLTPQVVGEFVRGESLPVSRGAAPEFRLWQDPYLETYHYNFESAGTRRIVHDALRVIPKLDHGARPHLAPGYYEIGIAECEGGGHRCYLYDMKTWGGR